MRKLIVRAFNISLDGVSASYGTEYFEWCMSGIDPRVSGVANHLPPDESQLDPTGELYGRADALIMGRISYQRMVENFAPGGRQTDHPWADMFNSARKVVFSRRLKTADWTNTTIAAGDTAEEIDKLRRGGDGHIVVYGGLSLWQSLMRLDLIDYFYLDVLPYVAGEGRRLFDNAGKYGPLDLVSSKVSSNGTLELEYRRHR
ncbi:MAG TPA: dihydrofolate reductase family protein [Jatrophihabitantaceae bacterium]|jgi:dihydrofolate reductase